LAAAAAVALAVAISAGPAAAAIGFSEFNSTFVEADGSPARQAGTHPFEMVTSVRVTTEEDPGLGPVPVEDLKDVLAKLASGIAGNPDAVPQCSEADFLNQIPGIRPTGCPNNTAVGGISILYEGPNTVWSSAVYNLKPRPGSAAKLGFTVYWVPVTIDAGLEQGAPYNITSRFTNIAQITPIYGATLRLWGDPSDPAHDPYRGLCTEDQTIPPPPYPQLKASGECHFEGAPKRAFLTLPRTCSGPLRTTYQIDSWQNPGSWLPDPPGFAEAPGTTGCAGLGFGPTIGAETTDTSAESPTGLDFELDVDDPGLTEPGGTAQSDMVKSVVTLPRGVTTNPSVVSGLATCSLAQYESESLDGDSGCPEASKVGTAEIETPLLEGRTFHGDIYVAKQGDNPFHNLLSIYLVVRDPELGILVKLPGRVDPDPATGQLTTTFDEIPQVPFSHVRLHLRSGRRAPLVTPPVCGSYQVEADLYPYARPDDPVHRESTLTVGSGPNGSPCANSAAQLPNSPGFSAGTLDPRAGSHSPFVLRLSRGDGSQQFSSITTTLPEGLTGRLAGIPYCTDAQITQAQGRGGEGQGALEVASPSCPAASEVGTVTVAAGAGPDPYYVQGHAYLAGPYKGAPLSLEIITPAIAGPFDLGVVAVRTALRVDLQTAEITAASDPIPTLLHGLPLDVRSIAIDMGRPGFTLNPTSCEPKAITGSMLSTLGAAAPLDQYFQASDCAALPFRPKLKLQLRGATRRIGHPALKAVLTAKPGEAGIGRAQVNLPHGEFLDQGNLNKTCTRPVLVAGNCPKSSVYGKAKAWTPLLDKPLEGNVYLVGGYGYKLPALVAELDGQIRITLVGKVDSGKNKGIRNTFEVVPDAPVSRFVLEMKGGKKYGLLENSEDLCKAKKAKRRAIVRFTGQNGKIDAFKPLVRNDCGKHRKKDKQNTARRATRQHDHTGRRRNE
jgi:hypothetical protein